MALVKMDAGWDKIDHCAATILATAFQTLLDPALAENGHSTT